MLIFEDNVAADGIFPGSRSLVGNPKSNGSVVDIGEVVGKPSFNCVVVEIGSFTLTNRFTVKVNLKPLKRAVNVVNEFRSRQFSVGVLDP